jgi:predicted nucleic acid-binding protein
MPKGFFDTNVVLYAFSDDPRSSVAEALLSDGGDISVQVLNEFANIARRKLGFTWPQVGEALNAIRTLARAIHPVTLDTHASALRLAERYGFSLYDALIVAAALHARCATLYSEDMQDGLLVDGELRIVNPFTPGA